MKKAAILPPLRGRLTERRRRCIRTFRVNFGFCQMCMNPRRKPALHLVLEFAFAQFCVHFRPFVKGDDITAHMSQFSKASDLRLGVDLCRACSRRLVARIEAILYKGQL